MKKIPVTQPSLPNLDEFTPYINEIWQNKWLTNNGPMHQKLEEELCNYLNVEYISLFNNATIALIIALKALELEGEVITTPYSFIATAHAIEWNYLKPVFIDIEENGFNIDADKIEAAITPNTSAIMPVHCYGHPCNVEKIQDIAERYNLKIIYDAAHAFAAEYKGESLLNFGDVSVVSFHATKVFNTFEGGAIVTKNKMLKEKIDSLKNFGLNENNDVLDIGLNGKMSEINAAFGLVQLKHIETKIKEREKITKKYLHLLSTIPGIKILNISSHLKNNYSYFPLLVTEEFRCSRDELYADFIKENIIVRKYFYPLISNTSIYIKKYPEIKDAFKNASDRSNKVLCLPLFSELEDKDLAKIINILKGE